MSFTFASQSATQGPRGPARNMKALKHRAGRGAWGQLDDIYAYPLPIDEDDPIYDTQEDTATTEWVESCPIFDDTTICNMLQTMVKEYFSHGDVNEARRVCESINWPKSRAHVVFTIVPLSFSFTDAERELCSVLLNHLVQQGVLLPRDIQSGFEELLGDLPSLQLDAPKAGEFLFKFMTRAVADGCLDANFVLQHPYSSEGGPQAQVIHHAQAVLTAPHNHVHIEKIWGDHAEFRDLGFAKSRIQALLQELLVSADVTEACRCIKDLNVPHFVHEVVFQAIYLAMECGKQPHVLDLVCELLHRMSTSGFCSSDQMTLGFRRVYAALDEILIDIPYGYRFLSHVVETCYNRDTVTSACVQELPQRRTGRRREISEAESDMSMDMESD